MAERSVFKIARTANGSLIRIVGRGTMQESPSFRDFVAGCLDRGEPVVVDLSDCDYLDSTFLGCFIGLHKRSRRTAAATLRILADEPTRVRLFSTTLLDRLLDFVGTPPTEIGEFIAIDLQRPTAGEFGQHVMQCHRLLAELGGADAHQFQAIADQLQREVEELPESGG